MKMVETKFEILFVTEAVRLPQQGFNFVVEPFHKTTCDEMFEVYYPRE